MSDSKNKKAMSQSPDGQIQTITIGKGGKKGGEPFHDYYIQMGKDIGVEYRDSRTGKLLNAPTVRDLRPPEGNYDTPRERDRTEYGDRWESEGTPIQVEPMKVDANFSPPVRPDEDPEFGELDQIIDEMPSELREQFFDTINKNVEAGKYNNVNGMTLLKLDALMLHKRLMSPKNKK